MEMKKLIAYTAFFFILTGFLCAEDRSPRRLYDAAIVELSKNTDESKVSAIGLFKSSAIGFEAASSSDYRHWFDAGTARVCAEEPALAILDLRRFLAHDYFRAEAWDNLAEARKSALTRSPGGEGPSTWPWSLWFLDVAAMSLGLALLSLGFFIFTRKKSFFRLMCGIAAFTVILSGATAVSLAVREPLAVILADTQGRKGDADVYAAQPATPWKAGQEAWVIGKRGDWIRIKVGSDISWVREDSVEMISK